MLLGLALAASACGTIPPDETRARVERALDFARARLDAGEPDAARPLLRAVRSIDPEEPALSALGPEGADDSSESAPLDTPWLGSNRARRLDADRPGWARALLYFPDRVLDLLDVVSFDVHVGPGAFVDVHATRALQLAAGGRFVGGFGWHDARSLGVQFQGETALNLPVIGASAYLGGKAGTSGVALTRQALAGLHRPSDPFHQEWRDYWSVGFAVTAVVAGVDFDLHPVELADFVAGFTTIDFLADDFAGTRGIGWSGREADAASELMEVAFSEEAVRAYRASVAGRR